MSHSREISLLPVLQKEQLSSLLDSLPSIVSYVDKHGRFCYANATYASWIGVSKDDIVGKTLREVLGEQACAALKPYVDEALAGNPVRFEKEVHYTTGTRYISAIYTPEFDEEKNVLGYSALITDLTGQKKFEAELKLKNEELEDYVDNACIALHWVDSRGIIIWANKAEMEMLGYSPEEYIGQHISNFHANQDTLNDILTRLFNKENLVNYEASLKCRDGSIRYVLISSNVSWREGQFAHTRCFTIDITEKKLAEQKLQEQEYKYRQALENLSVAIYTVDTEGHLTFFNPAAAELWGRKPLPGEEAWCGSWKIFDSAGKPLSKNESPMARALQEELPVYGEEIIIERPDGQRLNVLPHPRPVFDASGKLSGGINLLLDITELKYVHEALLEGEERFRNMADHAPVIIWMTDDSGCSIYWNKEWERLTGTSLHKGLGEGWQRFIHPDDQENAISRWEEAFARREPFIDKFRYLGAKGDYRIMNAYCTPRFSEENIFMGYIGILNDVTLLETTNATLENIIQERTRDLTRANSELERSNHELEQFAYAASHDLQEPLRKIQTFSERIIESEKDTLSATARDYFSRMNHAASRMQHLITDLLAFSRIKNLEQKDFESVDLNLLLDEAKYTLNFAIEQSGAVIKSADLPAASVIPFQFRQVFQNIISNSIKYRKPDEQPQIDISYHFIEARNLPELRGNGQYLQLSIKDNGIGFDPQFDKKIFEIFQRLHGKSEYSGTGVGLAICKKIVQNHNGHINAIGEPGIGATFNIYIPANT